MSSEPMLESMRDALLFAAAASSYAESIENEVTRSVMKIMTDLTLSAVSEIIQAKLARSMTWADLSDFANIPTN